MSATVQTFIANVKRAIWNQETAIIGGGEFTPSELKEIVKALESLKNTKGE